jgi:uncharacterized protein (TIRG00374 family)
MSRQARWLTRLLGPAILAYFLVTTDLHRIAAILREVRWTPLVLSLALFAGVVGSKAWRWRRLIAALGMPTPTLGRAATLFLIGQFAGAATPGQSGDFVRAWYLRERGSALSTALFSILFDRLLDFLLLALVSLVGLVAFLDVFPPAVRPPILVATVGFAAVMVAVVPALMARRSRRWLFERLRGVAPESFRHRLTRWQSLLETLELHPPLVLALLASTIVATLVVMVRVWLLFRALDVGVPMALVVAASALISILQTVPVSIAGVGVRDAVLVAVLARHGYPAERALALSALFLVLVVEQMLLGFLVAVARRSSRDATEDLPRRAAALAARAVVRDAPALPRLGRGGGLSGHTLPGAAEPRPPHRRRAPRLPRRAGVERAHGERGGLLRLCARPGARRSPRRVRRRRARRPGARRRLLRVHHGGEPLLPVVRRELLVVLARARERARA